MPSETAGEEKTSEYTDQAGEMTDVRQAVTNLDANVFGAIRVFGNTISHLGFDNEFQENINTELTELEEIIDERIGNLITAIENEEIRLQRQGQGGRGRGTKKTKRKSKKSKSRKR